MSVRVASSWLTSVGADAGSISGSSPSRTAAMRVSMAQRSKGPDSTPGTPNSSRMRNQDCDDPRQRSSPATWACRRSSRSGNAVGDQVEDLGGVSLGFG